MDGGTLDSCHVGFPGEYKFKLLVFGCVKFHLSVLEGNILEHTPRHFNGTLSLDKERIYNSDKDVTVGILSGFQDLVWSLSFLGGLGSATGPTWSVTNSVMIALLSLIEYLILLLHGVDNSKHIFTVQQETLGGEDPGPCSPMLTTIVSRLEVAAQTEELEPCHIVLWRLSSTMLLSPGPTGLLRTILNP